MKTETPPPIPAPFCSRTKSVMRAARIGVGSLMDFVTTEAGIMLIKSKGEEKRREDDEMLLTVVFSYNWF
jgi:hypothetical protein